METQEELKQVVDDNKKLLEELLAQAQDAPEPSAKTQVVSEGSPDVPAPIIAKREKSAGYVYLYEIKTGEKIPANRNMLKQLLEVVNADGTRRFTTVKPNIEPKRGILKCLLHTDDPNRTEYNEMGFPVCKKSNITNKFQVTRHMQKRHPVEWAAIEEARKQREKDEDKEFQRFMLKEVTKANKKEK